MSTTFLKDVNGEHLILKPILENWLKQISLFPKDKSDYDVPWRYGEWASLSFFAGAIWNCGGIVLSEYSTQKTNDSGVEYFGRGDMYFRIDSKEFDVEAKQVIIELNANRNYDKIIQYNLCKAKSDLSKSKDYGYSRLAILSIVVYFKINSNFHNDLLNSESFEILKTELLRFVESIKCNHYLSAWFINDLNKLTIFEDSKHSNFYYPGTALIIFPITK